MKSPQEIIERVNKLSEAELRKRRVSAELEIAEHKRQLSYSRSRLREVLKEKTSVTSRWRRQCAALYVCKQELSEANSLIRDLQKSVAQIPKPRTIWMNNAKIIKIIAALFDLEKTFRIIADEHDVSPTRIQQIYAQARDLGVSLPERQMGRQRSVQNKGGAKL